VEANWVWNLLFEPFKKHGDIFLTVCPGTIYIWSANAEANLQICSRREAFPKALESYAILEIFGRNIVTTEGIQWKQHRKVSAPSFNEKNNALVFSEACNQAQGMLRNWLGGNKSGSKTIKEIQEDTLRLTLYIISSIGFGVHLLWPGQKPSEKQSAKDEAYSSNEPPEGHTMTFEDALTVMLEHMIAVLIIPKWLLSKCRIQGMPRNFLMLYRVRAI
jgi:cytochrome P450